jgi:hypothetical protein
MPEFYRVSFDDAELDAIRRGCDAQSAHEDRMLDEAAGGSLEGVVMQESRADDVLLIKGTVALFKPGQTILITREDLRMIRSCLEDDASPGARSAVKKIDASLASGAKTR